MYELEITEVRPTPIYWSFVLRILRLHLGSVNKCVWLGTGWNVIYVTYLSFLHVSVSFR